MLDGGGVVAVFVVGGEDGAVVELADGGVADVPVRSECWRGGAAFSDNELVFDVPG